MDINQIINLILRRWWVFVIFAVVTGGIAFYMNYYVYAPVYQATATIFVNDKDQVDPNYGIAYDQILANTQLIADYTELMKSRTIAEGVIKDLQLKDYDVETVGSMIDVSARNETRIIEISVTDTDPKLAMDIANSVAKVFSRKAVELMNVLNVNIIDTARLPEYPIGPQKARNTAMAVLVALILAGGLILAVEYLDNTIKTSDDVENRLGLTVLGTIPDLRLK